MNNLTTKQLLQVLPMDDAVRNNIVGKYDSLSDDQKLEIKKICWTMFFQLYNDEVKKEFQKTLEDVKKLKKHPRKDVRISPN